MNLLTPIITGKWSILARIIGGCLIILTVFLIHQIDANFNYNKGYKKAYNQALIDHPQNNYYGPTTVIQGKKMTAFPFHMGHWGAFICHD